jgi:GNAT superfamily N-acetyltransferase
MDRKAGRNEKGLGVGPEMFAPRDVFPGGGELRVRMPAPRRPADPGTEGLPARWTLGLAILVLAVAVTGCASPDDTDAERNQAQVAFDFEGARAEDPQRTEHTVDYDPERRPTMDLYEDASQRPDAYTVHDMLADLDERTDTSIVVEHHEAFGYRLAQIDGVPAADSDRFWALYVDGERETAGIGTIVVEEDATYEWRLDERTTAAPETDARARDNGDRTDETRTAMMVVDYNGFRSEDPQRTEDLVRFHPEDRPTMPRYEAADRDRPDAYILHDLVSDWSNQTGTDYIAREDEEMGFQLASVDGVTAHSTQGGSWVWKLVVDDAPTRTGLDAVEVQPRSTYEWTFERSRQG